MATRPPIECPLCRTDLPRGQQLVDHLVEDHSKRNLAKFVVSETKSLDEGDISEE